MVSDSAAAYGQIRSMKVIVRPQKQQNDGKNLGEGAETHEGYV